MIYLHSIGYKFIYDNESLVMNIQYIFCKILHTLFFTLDVIIDTVVYKFLS